MRSCPLQRSLERIKYGLHFTNRHWRNIWILRFLSLEFEVKPLKLLRIHSVIYFVSALHCITGSIHPKHNLPIVWGSWSFIKLWHHGWNKIGLCCPRGAYSYDWKIMWILIGAEWQCDKGFGLQQKLFNWYNLHIYDMNILNTLS